jgi:hypothetical protein
MIQWIEDGGVAKVSVGELEHDVKVVREDGRKPYLATVANGERTNTIALLPRF